MKKRVNNNVEAIAYKFRIYPDIEQENVLAKTFGCVRYLWNRMLADHNELYKVIGRVPDNTPADYKELDECSWLSEVDSLALCNVQLNLQSAFVNFYEKRADYPVFHKKHKRQTYTTNAVNNNIKLFSDSIKLPKISNPIKMNQHRKIRQGGKLKSVTVSKEVNGQYYASILFEYPLNTFIVEPTYQKNPNVIGLDMKLGSLYVDNNGDSANMPDFYRNQEAKLAKEQTKLSYMQKGSNNYKRQRRRLAKLHMKIKWQRLDFLHKTTYRLANAYDVICIEDLDLRSMASSNNSVLHSKSVHSNAYGIFINWLKWECKKTGSVVIEVDRYFPSTQLCHICGHKQKLKLSERVYICPVCGNIVDRDENSAINIKTEGLRIYHEQIKTV